MNPSKKAYVGHLNQLPTPLKLPPAVPHRRLTPIILIRVIQQKTRSRQMTIWNRVQRSDELKLDKYEGVSFEGVLENKFIIYLYKKNIPKLNNTYNP